MYSIILLIPLISNTSDHYIWFFIIVADFFFFPLCITLLIWQTCRQGPRWRLEGLSGCSVCVCGCGTVWILRALPPQNCRATCQSLSNPPAQSPLTSSTPVWPNPHILLSSPHRSKVPVRTLSSSPSSIASSLGSPCQSPPALSLFLAERHGPAMPPPPQTVWDESARGSNQSHSTESISTPVQLCVHALWLSSWALTLHKSKIEAGSSLKVLPEINL